MAALSTSAEEGEKRTVCATPVIICWYSGQLFLLTLMTHSGESRRGDTLRERTHA